MSAQTVSALVADPVALDALMRFMRGQLTDAEKELLVANVRFKDIRYHKWRDLIRQAAIREIARIVRVPVSVECDIENEYDDNGATYPTYYPKIRPAADGCGQVLLDSEIDCTLDGIETTLQGAALVDILGPDRSTVTLSEDENEIEDVAVTDEGKSALFMLYEAIVHLAMDDISLPCVIEPDGSVPY